MLIFLEKVFQSYVSWITCEIQNIPSHSEQAILNDKKEISQNLPLLAARLHVKEQL